MLRAGVEKLSDRQIDRIVTAIGADDRHEAVSWAWRCAQDLSAAYRDPDLTNGRSEPKHSSAP